MSYFNNWREPLNNLVGSIRLVAWGCVVALLVWAGSSLN
jgi:hypothetical protein